MPYQVFQQQQDVFEPDDRKKLSIHKLLQDANSQLSLDRLKPNRKLLKALTDAAVGGGVDDKEYVVSGLLTLLQCQVKLI